MKKVSFLTTMIIAAMFGISTLTANAQTKKIGMTKAKAIASEKVSGKIESSELEKEHGKMIYSFDIRNAKGTITEVNVDAYTGAIIAVEEENKNSEAKEKQEEKNEKKSNSRKH